MPTTTTNFGWTVPSDTDLVKDGAAAIRTALGGPDTSFVDLKGGTTGQVLSKASNTDLDFSWVAQDDSNAIQNAIVDAKGDLIAATAADTPARLAVGTNGQVLTADSTAATGIKWANPAGGGKVLQVVQSTYSTSLTVASTTWTDTGLSVSITPTLSTSKILVMVTQSVGCRAISYAVTGAGLRILRGSTAIFNENANYQAAYTWNDQAENKELYLYTAYTYLDSPATTSATTYKTQGRTYVTTGSGEAYFNVNGATSAITVMEIGA